MTAHRARSGLAFSVVVLLLGSCIGAGIDNRPKGLRRLEMPAWLQDLTGLTDWPDTDPPYIPVEQLHLEDIPDEPREMGECREGDCAFDCDECVANDIASCPVLSQTFDDGPTPATAKLLQDIDGVSTFFVLGQNVVEHPAIFRKAQQDGHLMGTHAWSHEFLPALSNEEVAAQLLWSIWAMNATGNIIPRYFRPPYGGVDNRVRKIAHQLGLIVVLWDRDPQDWKLEQGDTNVHQILELANVWNSMHPPRGLILQHDTNQRNVKAILAVNRLLPEQMTVADCADLYQWYQKGHNTDKMSTIK